MPTAEAVVAGYFKAVRATDVAALGRLFTANTVLISRTVGRMKGGARIAAFYGRLLARLGGAEPRLGRRRTFGNTVIVEVEARHRRETHKLAVFFTVKRGKIARIAIYQGPIYRKGSRLADLTRTAVRWPSPPSARRTVPVKAR